MRRCAPRAFCSRFTGGALEPAAETTSTTARPEVVASAPMTFPITKAKDVRPLLALGDPDESVARRWLRRLAIAAAGSVAGAIFWDVQKKDWSVYHTWSTALTQYALFKALGLVGRWQLRQLLKEVEDGQAVQLRLLEDLLLRHGRRTQYGQDKGLVGASTLEEFRSLHPITQLSDYAEYFSQACEGRAGVLAAGNPATALLLPTSAVGQQLQQPAVLPVTADAWRSFLLRGVCVAFAVMEAEFPAAVDGLQRSSKLLAQASQCEQPQSGLDLRSSLWPSPGDWSFQKLQSLYASPPAAYRLAKEPEALYAHALCALKDPNLGFIEADSAGAVCSLLETIREHRRSLVQDLRNGHVWDRRMLESAPSMELRDAIDAALGGPDPHRAFEVERLLRDGAPASKLWPKLHLVIVENGGGPATEAAATEEPRLRELLGDAVEVHVRFLAAPEALLGVNVAPRRPFGVPTFVLHPSSAFLELLPLPGSSQRPGGGDAAERRPRQPVPASEAEIGEVYELVVTTRSGLCRCRVGVAVRVQARMGEMPIVSVEELRG